MPRADALRSREAILSAARRLPVDTLRLNDVARDAGVGVATVYRHFPTVSALVEALAVDSIERLRCLAAEAWQNPDAGSALRGFLDEALDLLLADEGVQPVILAPEGELSAALETRCAFVQGFGALLQRAQSAGAVRADVTVDQLQRLLCGMEHAVRLGAPDDRALLLDIMLAGLRDGRVTA
jgi:AcrR family transcriptional regulator